MKGYPTLKFFIDGKPGEYNGGRTEKEIVSWINRKMGPAVLDKQDKSTFNKHLESEPLTVAYFGDKDNSNF